MNKECTHENITVDEMNGERFCEDCGSFVDADLQNSNFVHLKKIF